MVEHVFRPCTHRDITRCELVQPPRSDFHRPLHEPRHNGRVDAGERAEGYKWWWHDEVAMMVGKKKRGKGGQSISLMYPFVGLNICSETEVTGEAEVDVTTFTQTHKVYLPIPPRSP